jgi:hypothetical protein
LGGHHLQFSLPKAGRIKGVIIRRMLDETYTFEWYGSYNVSLRPDEVGSDIAADRLREKFTRATSLNGSH